MAFFIREDIYKKSTRGCNFLGVRLVSESFYIDDIISYIKYMPYDMTHIICHFLMRRHMMHFLSSLVLTDFTTTSGSITASKSTKQLNSVNGHITSLMEFQFVPILENLIISFNSTRDQTEMIFLQILILLWLVHRNKSYIMGHSLWFIVYES